MMFNVGKREVMNIGFKNRNEDYALNGIPLHRIKEEKDLGITICQDLKVGKQCFKAAYKGYQVLG